jgi:hypothetical protein
MKKGECNEKRGSKEIKERKKRRTVSGGGLFQER